ncbi:hypothetical protein GYMLUDRAFT_989120 [Collybiopsis luxurians FD-317 M1]|uniref:Uncharacterized protein n=1 Tax=Collybiopsis luxurians FD-317 M1 TaxID=944289 RepID=A0A0D0D1M2_9AGAR|nr:hypothetical protein GYMLUDRAFT_989120 [Collybiopsis luxurians FD-317 M1]
MILDDKTLPLTPTEVKSGNPVIQVIKDVPDAPPSYDIVVTAETSSLHSGQPTELSEPDSSYSPPSNPYRLRSNYASSSTVTVSAAGDASSSASLYEPNLAPLPLTSPSSSTPYTPPTFIPKHKRSWFGGKSRTIKEVREWASNVIQDLLGRSVDLEECKTVLSGCKDALSTYNIAISTFLQEPLFQQHTFFHWSVVNRPSESTRFPSLLSALLPFGSPLTDETRADIRHACLLINDQGLFQSLRCHRDFMRLPTSHEMVFGDGIPIDDITVENMPSAEPAFLVKMDIAQFVKRMNFEKDVTLEFIAQRDKHPKWDLTLTLLENSESTPIDSRFVIEDVSPSHDDPSYTSSKPKPSQDIRMKHSMLVPAKKDKIVVSLEDGSLIGSSIRSP